ncbi:uncharacterized [Tachysurus ichikawai]
MRGESSSCDTKAGGNPDDAPNVPQSRRDFRNSGTHQVGVCESSKGKIAAVGLGQIPTVDFKTAAEQRDDAFTLQCPEPVYVLTPV